MNTTSATLDQFGWSSAAAFRAALAVVMQDAQGTGQEERAMISTGHVIPPEAFAPGGDIEDHFRQLTPAGQAGADLAMRVIGHPDDGGCVVDVAARHQRTSHLITGSADAQARQDFAAGYLVAARQLLRQWQIAAEGDLGRLGAGAG